MGYDAKINGGKWDVNDIDKYIEKQLKSSSLQLALKPPWEGLHFASCNTHKHRSLDALYTWTSSRMSLLEICEKGGQHKHRPNVFHNRFLSSKINIPLFFP